MDRLARQYELAWEAMDHLETQGVEITELIAQQLSAMAAACADVGVSLAGLANEDSD
jgi:hypothetical protein